MKVVYCIRPEYWNGGDGVQALKTKEYIEQLYPHVSIDIVTSPKELTESYDIAHIFNYATTDLTNAFFKKAKELKLKIVSSPIYWDYKYSINPFPLLLYFNKEFIDEDYVNRNLWFNKLLSLIPLKKFRLSYNNISPLFSKKVSFFINNSELILPNSIEEGRLCCQFGKVNESIDKIRVIYNGVDISGVSILEEKEFFSKYNIPHDYILQVGRVEYLKNQLNLISALMDYPQIPIVILGSDQTDPKYVRKVRSLAEKRGNVYFLSSVPHKDVYSFYHYAKTHVLLSLRESPGLVNLEALSQGCPIVISDKRFLPVDTYFSENYESVNPFDKYEITQAVLKSYSKSRIKVDLSRFSWDKIAKATYNAYNEII